MQLQYLDIKVTPVFLKESSDKVVLLQPGLKFWLDTSAELATKSEIEKKLLQVFLESGQLSVPGKSLL